MQSVKGKVIIDAFPLINPHTVVMGHGPAASPVFVQTPPPPLRAPCTPMDPSTATPPAPLALSSTTTPPATLALTSLLDVAPPTLVVPALPLSTATATFALLVFGSCKVTRSALLVAHPPTHSAQPHRTSRTHPPMPASLVARRLTPHHCRLSFHSSVTPSSSCLAHASHARPPVRQSSQRHHRFSHHHRRFSPSSVTPHATHASHLVHPPTHGANPAQAHQARCASSRSSVTHTRPASRPRPRRASACDGQLKGEIEKAKCTLSSL